MVIADRQQSMVAGLPLPLAQTLRRALNAKSHEGQHLGAYYFFESTLKLSASAQVGVYVKLGCPDPRLNTLLGQLARPSAGHWLAILREASKYLAARPDAALQPLEGVHERLTRREARPTGKAMLEFSARLKGEREGRTALSVLDVFDGIVAYRNHELGHGAQRPEGVYEEGWSLIVGAVVEALEALRPLGDLALSVARDLADRGTGRTERRYEALRGDGVRLALPEIALDESDKEIPAGSVVLAARGTRVSLHPLVVHEVDDLDRDRVGYLNHATVREKERGTVVQRVEYLDYDSGARLDGHDARQEMAKLLGRLGGRDVRVSEVDALSQADGTGEGGRAEEPSTGKWIGDYELLGELGRGGMGVVYKARQQSLGRVVALKVLPPAMAGDPVSLARFKREIGALARCDHPNVVKVLTAGQADQVHYYAMEYVEGSDLAGVYEALSEWKEKTGGRLTEGHLLRAISTSTRGRVVDGVPGGDGAGLPDVGKVAASKPEVRQGRDYYLKLAEVLGQATRGVQHLHEHGIIHRDLKPGNIMLTSDGHRAVVMDLGLAQVGDRSRSLTATSVKVLGTLRYMPPEQLQRNLLDVTQQADVYSLGATLYELACLAPMHDGDTEERLIRQVLTEEPKTPRRQNQSIPRDLETIVQVSTAKLVGERYGSAQALAEDLEAFGRGVPIRTRRPGALYYLKLFYRKNRAVANVAMVFLLLMVAGAAWYIRAMGEEQRRTLAESDRARKAEIDALKQAEEARRNADAAEKARQEAEHARREALEQKNYAVTATRRAEEESQRALGALEKANRNLSDALVFKADIAVQERSFLDAITYLAFAREGGGGARAEAAGFGIPNPVLVLRSVLPGHAQLVTRGVFSPDGRVLATGAVDGEIKLWDVTAAREIRTLSGHKGAVFSLAFSPDGKLLASASEDKTVKLWNVSQGMEGRPLSAHEGSATAVAFSPDGLTLASASADGTVKLVNLLTGLENFILKGHKDLVACVTFSPDGKTLASGSRDNTIKMWDAQAGRELRTLRGHDGTVRAVEFSPDGRRLASGGHDRIVRIWDAADGRVLVTLGGFNGWVQSLALSKTGRTMITASSDGAVRLWDVDTWKERGSLSQHGAGVATPFAAVSPDGRTLAIGIGNEVALWDATAPRRPRVLEGHLSSIHSTAFFPDGRTLATAAGDGSVLLWDLFVSGEPRSLPAGTVNAGSLAASPDGRTLAIGGRDNVIALWDIAELKQLRRFADSPGKVRSVAFSPDGRLLAGGSTGRVLIWECRGGNLQRTFSVEGDATSVCFSPDGRRLAGGTSSGVIVLWDAIEGSVVHTLKGMASVNSISFHPDGTAFACSTGYESVRVYRTENGDLLQNLSGHAHEVSSVAFSPDGLLLATASFDRTVKLWDPYTRVELRTLLGHSGRVTSLAFSPDSKVLASGGDDQAVRLWGGYVPRAVGEMERLTGRTVVELSLSPLSSDQRKARFGGNPRAPTLPALPSKELAAYWRALWEARRHVLHRDPGTPEPPLEMKLAPLREWIRDNPDDFHLTAARREYVSLLRSAGFKLSPPSGWEDSTSVSKGKNNLAVFAGPGGSFFHLLQLPPMVIEDPEAAERYLHDFIDGYAKSTRLEIAASGKPTSETLGNGVAAHMTIALLNGKPRLAAALTRLAGTVVLGVAIGSEPESTLRSILGSFAVIPHDASLSPAIDHVNRADTRRGKGDLKGAIADLDRAIELDPAHPLAYMHRGRAKFEGGDFDGAIHDFTRAIQIKPDYGWAHNYRGVAHEKKADDESALQDYARALEIDWQYALVYRNRGMVKRRKGDPAGAIQDCSMAIQLDPDDVAAHNGRGLAREAKGDIAGALADFTRALEIDSQYKWAAKNRGDVKLKKKDYEGAILDFSRAIELDPGYVDAFNERGRARQGKGDRDGALADFTKALELDPKYKWAFYNRGLVRVDQKDLEGAVQDFTRAVELDPKYKFAYQNRGYARYQNKEFDAAIDDCTKALEIDPAYAWAFSIRGLARKEKGDLERAESDFSRALEIDPKYTSVYRNRGGVRQAKGRIDEALADFDKAIELDPKSPFAYEDRARARLAKGDETGAVADLERVAALDPLKGRQLLVLHFAARGGRPSATPDGEPARRADIGTALVHFERYALLRGASQGWSQWSSDPFLKPLGNEARFIDVKKRLEGAAGSGDERYALLKTNFGEIQIELYPEDAPRTVQNFVTLAKRGFYDGLTFHRIIPGFMMQGGCPKGDGTGGPGHTVAGEFNARKHVAGTVSLARAADPDSGGSQFYIMFAPHTHLDGKYAVFGHVVKGMDVLQKIERLGSASGTPREKVLLEKLTVSAKGP